MIFSQILRISIHYFQRHFWQVEIEKFTCNHWGKLFILWCLGGEIFSEKLVRWGNGVHQTDETPRLGLLTTCSPSYQLSLRNHAATSFCNCAMVGGATLRQNQNFTLISISSCSGLFDILCSCPTTCRPLDRRSRYSVSRILKYIEIPWILLEHK